MNEGAEHEEWGPYVPMSYEDMDELNPFQLKLLGHYRREASRHGGTVIETLRETAAAVRFSVGKVHKTRCELVDLGRIEIEGERVTRIVQR